MTEHQLILVLLFCPTLQNRWKQRSTNTSKQECYIARVDEGTAVWSKPTQTTFSSWVL